MSSEQSTVIVEDRCANLLSLMGKVPLKDFCVSPNILMNPSDTVETCMKQLLSHNLQQILVVEKTGAYVGFITLLRICAAVVDLCDSINHRNLYSVEYYDQIRRFRQTPIEGLVERPRRREVHPHLSLMHGMESLQGQAMIAVLVSNKASNVIGMFNTNRYMGWIYDNIEEVGDIRDLRVCEFRPQASVTCLRSSSTAVAGYRLMAQMNAPTLGIVDAQQRLVDVLSLDDLKVVRPTLERFSRLFDSCISYRQQSRAEPRQQPYITATLMGTGQKIPIVTEADTFEQVLQLMVCGGHPQVFVVGDSGKMNVIDVINQSDILELLLVQLQALRGF